MSEDSTPGVLQEALRQFRAAGPPAAVTGVAGGGAVRITLEGLERVTAVSIDPESLADGALLEDLVLSAMNAALAQARQAKMESASGLLQSLGLQSPEWQ